MDNCIFCKIIRGELPSTKLYEDEDVLSFLDINPINPGHALVIPKEHFQLLKEMHLLYAEPMWETGRLIAQALRDADIACDGVNFHLADGSIAGQEVPHVHLHVIPRFKGDKAGYRFPPERKKPDDDEWKRIADSIRSKLKSDNIA